MWKPSLKHGTWKLVSELLTGTTASSQVPVPGRQLPFGSGQEASRQALGGSTLLLHPFLQAIFKPHVSTSAFALQMCFSSSLMLVS